MLKYIMMKLKNKSEVEYFVSLCPYQAAAAFMSQPNTAPSSLRHMGLGHMLGDPIGSASGSPSSTTPMTTSASNSTGGGTRSGGQNHTGGGEGETIDVGRLQEECNTLRGQVQKWEESWAQAKQVRSSQLPIQQCTPSL